jgi:hypothetical protein
LGEFIAYSDGMSAAHATTGYRFGNTGSFLPGDTYGNIFLLPLRGGSGGSGEYGGTEDPDFIGVAGGGGGGAILIAASGSITLTEDGVINANGGTGGYRGGNDGGTGSGGGIRLVAPVLDLDGSLTAYGHYTSGTYYGSGHVRIEGGGDAVCTVYSEALSRTSVPGITILPANYTPELAVTSIAGIAVPATPLGELAAADVDIPAVTSNPVDVEVACANLAPGTEVAVRVTPEFGPSQTYTATNTGTYESSTATVSVDLPTGGGVIMATATSTLVASAKSNDTELSLLETGLAPTGERFATARVTAIPGGGQRTEYITASGAAFSFPPEQTE